MEYTKGLPFVDIVVRTGISSKKVKTEASGSNPLRVQLSGFLPILTLLRKFRHLYTKVLV